MYEQQPPLPPQVYGHFREDDERLWGGFAVPFLTGAAAGAIFDDFFVPGYGYGYGPGPGAGPGPGYGFGYGYGPGYGPRPGFGYGPRPRPRPRPGYGFPW
ncbi:hypothetical protein SAMN05421676_105262 [Salinibacillus kushneri]|uniref:Uncharacterized protein n=1 Tax=Salinibacillus kushneri TaxID=237682 RepID=A0A1I0FAA4_9BACI|nr:hypothetical protein [Salinibacillus kushneri]SET55042.1 hypothetical protein SAMN05421676_105262 [Salinibacillus kushneri]